ncbi:uncharacterized protein LOC129291273 isoform X1 [Prosopis cineraria]|uniref:uncharacterized protein LOC129291273 isoform X1 n=1 Tax=Prosopis cineraria TaxID=364024 RepID=UPI00240FE1D6|nr:uncharacterized protein LOC129291273 isoform X1 [Prosopis cineraria]
MLENPPPAQLQSAATDSPAPVKRYAPPNQRNRSNNRRKSADGLDRANSLGNDLEKNQYASRSVPVTDHGDAGGSNHKENHYSGLVGLEGCSNSVASQLLNDRWTAAMQSYNHSKDSSEKPVMHSGGTAAWTHLRLPHQIVASSPGNAAFVSQMDFLGELRRQMHSANSAFDS